jgi:transposase-like protein
MAVTGSSGGKGRKRKNGMKDRHVLSCVWHKRHEVHSVYYTQGMRGNKGGKGEEIAKRVMQGWNSVKHENQEQES